MRKFKEGDLAIIVGCHASDANLGKVVELIQRLMPGEPYCDPAGYMRRCAPDMPGAGWLVQGNDFISGYSGECWGLINERHLMPLKGEFQPEQQKSEGVEA